MAGAPADAAGGTGGAPCAGPAEPIATAAVEHAVVEQNGDLHEYGLSLGVDLDDEGEEDLLWAVREAFNAPLPSSWTEYMDDSGRAYYIKEGSAESTWEHPMDSVYRELFDMIRDARGRNPALTESQREDIVRQHLKKAHQRAKAELEGWSGPYASEQGEYYYSESLKVSTWECPVIEWEKELALRHAVLARYLMPEQISAAGSPSAAAQATGGHQMLQALRLQLGNLQRPPGSGQADWVPEPSTSRSFHTARSQGSSRSGRTKHSGHHADGKERKERKERRHREESGQERRARTSEERRAGREAAGEAGSPSAAAAGLPPEGPHPPGVPRPPVQGIP